MDTRRLRLVHDICPLQSDGVPPSFEATRWAAEAGQDRDAVTYHANGFTATVLENKLISWHRSFTIDNKPIRHTSRSLLRIEEWVPSAENAVDTRGWLKFGVPRRHAIAEVPSEGMIEQNWSAHAKRHLRIFDKQTHITLRLGTLQELEQPYAKSHINPGMRDSLWGVTDRHVRAHQETIDVLIAETKADGIIAAFVAGNCKEANASVYLLGFYLPPAAKTHAMTGLVKWWFERTREKGLRLCNFGDICGAYSLPFASDRGYSLFKTHFGVRRVHLPRSYWRISFR